MQTDLTESFLGPLRVSFSNDVDVKVTVDPLHNDFRSNSIVLLLFPSLSSCNGVSSRSIYYIPDLFILEYCLNKVGSLKLVLKTAELLSFVFAVVILVSYLADLDDLEEDKNVILVPVHTPDLIT